MAQRQPSTLLPLPLRQVLRVLQEEIFRARQHGLRLGLLLANRVHRLVDDLHDVKTVKRDLGLGQMLLNPFDKGGDMSQLASVIASARPLWAVKSPTKDAIVL
jgi:hypothetical protein